MKLCSACLLGVKCRYDGKSRPNEKVLALAKKEILIPVCPEQLGGQQTPRPNSEIKNGTGADVLKGKAKVVEREAIERGNTGSLDVTEQFIKGAEESLNIAKTFGIKEAILKQRSPACGSGRIYDGSFSGRLIKGDGVAAALLKKNKIKVISEEEL